MVSNGGTMCFIFFIYMRVRVFLIFGNIPFASERCCYVVLKNGDHEMEENQKQ